MACGPRLPYGRGSVSNGANAPRNAPTERKMRSLRMRHKQIRTRDTRAWRVPVVLLAATGTLALATVPWVTRAATANRYSGPLSSQPLAISADDEILAVTNPDNNTVSFFDAKNGRKFDEVAVQEEPNGVALTPDGTKAFVANTVSGTVSVIRISGKGIAHLPDTQIQVG